MVISRWGGCFPLTRARVGIDAGVVVLLWLVQLVIYPSFGYLDAERAEEWHQIYMERSSFLIGPLLGGQVAILGVQWLSGDRWRHGAAILLAAGMWAWTFWVSVPLHVSLQEEFEKKVVDQLVMTNWPRTWGWTAIAVLGWSVPMGKKED
ncbi:MAG: hypothetical protein AAGJ31_11415 [Verrucomicrobiota bacterium]